MSYCPKCGTKVSEEMAFCPKCGAALKVEQLAAPPAPPRAEKAEKGEKREKREKREKEEREEREKREKGEKREKREYAYIGPLIGGLIMIMLGLAFLLVLIATIPAGAVWAFVFVIIGIIIIVGATYAAMMASKRHPPT